MKKFIALLIFLTFTLFLSPFICLAQNQTELWGMTSGGGIGGGVIFKTNGNGDNQLVMYSFTENPGKAPKSDLCQASNEKLYGMTSYGGTNDMGVLFEYDPSTNNYTKKLDFAGATNGSNPNGSLMQASNGKLYGLTSEGGMNDMGVLFEYDPATNNYTKKLDFAGATNGGYPNGSLMQASNGKLYGLTSEGGANNLGVLFEYDPATGNYTKKLDFAGSTNGDYPNGSLIQASNGKLYGMTYSGGTNEMGVLFEYDPATGNYTKKLDFESGPYGSLMQASNGKLYGMTAQGGANDSGILFEYNTATNTYTKKLDFAGATNGGYPNGSLMQASNGKLYGMTSSGGINDMGVLFEYDPATNTFTKKLDFVATTNGSNPLGSLIQAANGKLYGMTYSGGPYDNGVLFEYDPATGNYIKKLDFTMAVSGGYPSGSLMQTSNGKLYGMTSSGGTNNMGVLFEYDPATTNYTKKMDFAGATNGGSPNGSLIQASNGNLYGMTDGGGANDMGVLFEYDPATDIYTKKLDFEWTINGSNPNGSLMQAYNGKLYGMTSSGGINDMGVLFEYDPATNTLTKKLDFAGATNGGYPKGSLMQASNGKLYGMTFFGGTNGFGVLFEYDPATNNYTKKLDFAGSTNGRFPSGSLMQASNGKLYGLTSEGGANDMGVLFEYDPATNNYTKKLDFAGATNGSSPCGSLMQSSTGKLYGMTQNGGTNYFGVLFEYDPATATYTKKLDFDGAKGGYPIYVQLIEQPGISAGPHDATICPPGSGTSFSIAATGVGLSLQWQVDEGSGFKDIIDNSIYSNATTNTLNITNASVTMNGYKFRCVVTSTYPVVSVFSNSATLIINTPASAGAISGNSTVCQGQNPVTYTVPAIANATSYIWTLPAGTTGTSATNSITINYGTSAVSGDITVKGNNSCGDGIESSLPIVVNTRPVKPAITQNEIVLHSDAINGNQWYNQNGLISGATNEVYTITTSGDYYVIVTINGCNSEPSNSINVVLTGIEFTKNNRSIKVYPNPVSNELIIDIEGSTEKTEFEIINSTGQKVFKGSLFEKTVVQMTDFSPGIYLIKIENGKTFEFKKIVK